MLASTLSEISDVVIPLLLLVIVILLLCLIRIRIRTEKEVLAGKIRDETFQRTLETQTTSFEKFFKRSSEYFDQSSLILLMVKAYVELARANHRDAKELNRETKESVIAQKDELNKVVAQAEKNSNLVMDKTNELKEQLPDLTASKVIERVNKPDSAVFITKTPSKDG